jgi:formate dehydrogenase subunit gamma
MGTGEVDINWAKEHHDVWLAEQLEKGNVGHSAPAE